MGNLLSLLESILNCWKISTEVAWGIFRYFECDKFLEWLLEKITEQISYANGLYNAEASHFASVSSVWSHKQISKCLPVHPRLSRNSKNMDVSLNLWFLWKFIQIVQGTQVFQEIL